MQRKRTVIYTLSLLLIGALSLVGGGALLWSKASRTAIQVEWEDAVSSDAEADKLHPGGDLSHDGPWLDAATITQQAFYALIYQPQRLGLGPISTVQGLRLPLFLLYGRLQTDG
jgi:hypothetical protein